MCSAFRRIGWALLAGAVLTFGAEARELRVCADPNNLPFSNEQRQGFENRIAEVLADELGATVSYTWWAQRRGFLRNTLNAGLCDVVMGIPAELEMVRATRPYYVSTYVFVTRGETIASLDDARLRDWRIGVPLVGDDGAATPPAHALARRGLAQNLRGYSVYGDYRETAPPARLVAAVAQHEVDVAIAWGPLAGYFATRQETPLRVTPVEADPEVPMRFAISLGVRRADAALARELGAALERRRSEIDAILADYGVPRPEAAP